MKASINLGFTQNLALTPQLQQSIKLLQLSSLELEQELILAAENNPFLDFESEMSASSQEQAPIISEINSIRTTNHSFDDENDPIFEMAQESSLFKNLIDQIQLLRITDYEKQKTALKNQLDAMMERWASVHRVQNSLLHLNVLMWLATCQFAYGNLQVHDGLLVA